MKGTEKSRALVASARHRRRALGVAMVEGAIVFPVMAGFLVMFELCHHSYEAYIQTGHVAEQRAWSNATVGSLIGNCKNPVRDDTAYKPKYFKMDSPGSGGNTSAGGNPQIQQNSGGSISGSGAGTAPGSGGWFIHHDSANATISVSRGTFQHTANASSTSYVFCNQPWVGSLLDIIKNAFKH